MIPGGTPERDTFFSLQIYEWVGFQQLKYIKGLGNLSFQSEIMLKRVNSFNWMVVRKWRKRFGFVIYIRIFKTIHLQKFVKEMKSSTRYVKGVPFVNRKYTKEVPFLSKMVCNRARGLTRGGALWCKTSLSTPREWLQAISYVKFNI